MKRFLNILWLTIAVLASAVNASAKHYYFNRYTTQEGLPNNRIYSVAQDKFGFIWVSTRDGVCRFDGNEFVEAGFIESESTITGDAMTMCTDEDGVIWFCSKDGLVCYDPATGDKKVLNCFQDKRVSRVLSDKAGHIWCISTNSLFKYDKHSEESVEYSGEEQPIPASMITDNIGNVWALTLQGGLYRYDKRNDTFKKIPLENVQRFAPTSDGRILVSDSNCEIRLLDVQTLNSEIIIPAETMKKRRSVYCMVERVPGEYWIGTETGVIVYTSENGSIDDFSESFEDKHSLSANHLTCIFADRDGNVWLGTYYSGLNLWQNNNGTHIYYDYKSAQSLKGNVVRPIKADKDGNLWIGTEDGELNRNNFKKHEMVNYLRKELFYNIQGLLPVHDEIWVASYGSGLIRFNPTSNKIIEQVPLASGYATRLFQTYDGTILIGTRAGLYTYNSNTDSYDIVKSVGSHFIHSIFQDHNGDIWIGSLGRGLDVLDSELNPISDIDFPELDLLSHSHISSISEDSKRRLWITTEGDGVFFTPSEVNVKDLRFKNITVEDGLVSNVTSATAEDNDGIIWISTTHGLSIYDPEKDIALSTFFSNSQITGCQYTQGSSCTLYGSIFMGTSDGMMSFSPAALKSAVTSRQLYITSVTAKSADKSISLSTPGHSALTSDRINVKSKDISTLEISFSSPDYLNILNVGYEYCLTKNSGKSNLKHIKADGNKAIFTNIKPGKYIFDVKMEGAKWEGSERQLEIRVTPPLLLTTVAKILYIIAALFIISAILYIFSKRRKAERDRNISQLENEKQKEIYDTKIKYFTNITHEIRTPLSLIKMPVDKIIATEGFKASAKEDMLTIKSNTDRLLELTNQLLDLRKVEQKELKLIFTKVDLREVVLKACDYFTVTAKERHIQLNVETPDSPVIAMCSADSVKKILTNLLSNAIKYGKDRIDVILSETEDKVSVRINSNGIKIDSAYSDRIFEPFFQVKVSNDQTHSSNGTGLGLPFARSLAELHSGRLYLDADMTDVNSFVLELPKKQSEGVIIKEEDNEVEPSAAAAIDNSKHTILIVEDSIEMRNYLGKELSGEYNTILTSNGEEAMAVVEGQKTDLVISDIMMPVMDGCELCNRIKTNIEYCHIPVILLTAAVGVETRIETLKVGADGYIEKPFSIDLLKANIANIFKNKEISYRQFTQSPLTHYNGVVVNNMDDDFMDKLHSEVMNHISEQDLNIEALTAILGTSKSTLYRKIKANTGLNINEYIRLCRLKEAAEMLSSQKYRINEVAYLVGFSSPSYFTTSFQKQFNISPSAFVKHIKQED
ncbi:MAG: two-component regulator propeller domain-containing protein [Bacteroidia bacterium]|nr:two-component regulator propeller domain-containing protein [Bacteroidia bacterium]